LKQWVAGFDAEQDLHRCQLLGIQVGILSLDVAQHLDLGFALFRPGHHLGFDG